MNKKIQFILLMTLILLAGYLSAQEKASEFPILKGPYLGQKPPGIVPEVFAPGIVSTDANEGCCCFSKGGQLFLFARAGSSLNGILMMEQMDGAWTKPRLAPFSAGKYDWDFMLAPDSRTVFISSGRPLKEGDLPQKNYRIWISERIGNGWSEPRLLSFPVNMGEHDSSPSVTKDRTLYFFSNRKGGLGEGDIFKSRRINEQYPEVENLDAPINTKYHEVDAFIAPDENYLIFCSKKPGGFGNADIYITFRNREGSWMEPVNMGDKINSSYVEYIPYVTLDGKYFFFTSNKSGNREIYWMDTQIIVASKPPDSDKGADYETESTISRNHSFDSLHLQQLYAAG